MKLYDHQQIDVQLISEAFKLNKSVLYCLATGGGKCLAKNTEIIMFDGSIKKVQDIIVNDLIMGDDSTPRKILSTCSGIEQMYDITPVKGDKYTVNESHILSLKITNIGKKKAVINNIRYSAGDIVDISVLDYLNLGKSHKHILKGFRVNVDFEVKNDLPIDPRFLGLWLADGDSKALNFTLHNNDIELIDFLREYSVKIDCKINVDFNSENSNRYRFIDVVHKGCKGSYNLNLLKKLNLFNNKHIPHIFKTASRNDRLKLLAGILDGDGHYDQKGFDLTLKSEQLMDDVIFIARSLGFSCYKSKCEKSIKSINFTGTYYRCSIFGDIDLIPTLLKRKKANKRLQKKDVLMTGISVIPTNIDEYFGFEIDGNKRFVLGDFTVTHNTQVFSYITKLAQQKNKTVWVLVHRVELVRQTSEALTNWGVFHGVINPNFKPDETQTVQVASVQTLIKRLDKYAAPDFIIIDEAHHSVANSYVKILKAYPEAKILGPTATPCRTDGKGLGHIFEQMVIGKNTRELIDMGFLVKPSIFAPKNKIDLSKVKTVMGDYDKEQLIQIVDKPQITGDAIEHYTKLCPGVPCVVFCVNVKHAENVAEQFREAGYRSESVDGTMKDDQRSRILGGLGKTIDVITSVNLISEGTDIPVITAIIILRPTKSLSLQIQMWGRALRTIYSEGTDRSNLESRLNGIKKGGKPKAFILDHVGSSWVHGFPEDHREWSLEGVTKKTKKKDDVLAISQCKMCYAVYTPQPFCPECFYRSPVQENILKQVSGELVEITDEQKKLISDKTRKEVSQNRSLEKLKKFGKSKGYGPGWAIQIYNSRIKKDEFKKIEKSVTEIIGIDNIEKFRKMFMKGIPIDKCYSEFDIL